VPAERNFIRVPAGSGAGRQVVDGTEASYPLVMGVEELKRSADVFRLNCWICGRATGSCGRGRARHVSGTVKFHRVQLEYELREKTILLRQGLLRGVEMLTRFGNSCCARCRHSPRCSARSVGIRGACQLVEAGAVQKLADKIGFDPRAFCNCLIFANGRLTPGLRTSTRCVAIFENG